MPRIRPYAGAGDDGFLDVICVRTGDAGQDATGRFGDDDLLPDVYLRPYLVRHPDLAFVLESDDGRPVGYVIGAPDTDAFDGWFRDEWWPPRAAHHDPGDGPVRDAAGRGRRPSPWAAYPAHLHIDLLPEAQGRGWGRRLIDRELAALRTAGAAGVHLAASAENAGAVAFYPKVGFDELEADAGVVVFGRAL